MNRHTYGLTISSLTAIIVGLIETFENIRKMIGKGLPHDVLATTLAAIAIASSLYATQELRHRMHILARRSALAALADMGFWLTTAVSAVLLVQSLLSPHLMSMLIAIGCLLPLFFFGLMKEGLEPSPSPQLDLFEWEKQERQRKWDAANALVRRREEEEFLRQNPAERDLRKLSMITRIKSGF